MAVEMLRGPDHIARQSGVEGVTLEPLLSGAGKGESRNSGRGPGGFSFLSLTNDFYSPYGRACAIISIINEDRPSHG